MQCLHTSPVVSRQLQLWAGLNQSSLSGEPGVASHQCPAQQHLRLVSGPPTVITGSAASKANKRLFIITMNDECYCILSSATAEQNAITCLFTEAYSHHFIRPERHTFPGMF